MRIAVSQFEPGPDPACQRRLPGVGRGQGRRRRGVAAAGSRRVDRLVPDRPGRTAARRPAARRPVRLGTGRRLARVRHHHRRRAPSCPIRTPIGCTTRSWSLAAGGVIAAYRKIHLYDAFSFVESDSVAPGQAGPPVIEIDGVPVGFATCYDLRFPELFRVLQSGGAQVLALASAWVKGPLKEEHWLTLLRARAIENTCYVVAADQSGRAGIGRSAAFDPFGLPLLDLGNADSGYGLVDVSTGTRGRGSKSTALYRASTFPDRAGAAVPRCSFEVRHRPTAGADRTAQSRQGALSPLRSVRHRIGAPHRGRPARVSSDWPNGSAR